MRLGIFAPMHEKLLDLEEDQRKPARRDGKIRRNKMKDCNR